MEIEISINRSPDLEKLIHLFQQAGWHDKINKARIKSMIEHSNIIVTAWDNKEMVGFARCTTDYTFNGQINNVVVDENYRNQGIGKKLINRILESSDKVTYILRADPGSIDFYKKLGFIESDLAIIYKRKQ
jgi:ribosomal protein S18 acetylase RimI-like enzyme